MAFDGLVTRACAAELARLLTHGKIEKIYQPEKDELVFHIHTKNGNRKLLGSCNPSAARVCLSQEDFSNPGSPQAFCMLLRKHFSGGRITEIRQYGTERIIEMDVETMNELGFSVNKRLIFEIMGKHSNIIAMDRDSGRIIDCIKRVSIDVNRARQLLPGQVYEYPPEQDKIPFDAFCADGAAQTGVSPEETEDSALLAKAILRTVRGLSPSASEEIAERALSLRKNTKEVSNPTTAPTTAAPPIASFVSRVLHEICAELHASPREDGRPAYTPTVYLAEDGAPVEFHIIRLSAFEDYYTAKTFPDISSAVEYFYTHKNSANRVKQKTEELSRSLKTLLDKLYLKKQRLSEDLLKAEKSDELRLYGELLTAHLHEVAPGAANVTVQNYYTGEPVSIPLDIRFSAAKNAQNYFKRYGKSRTAIREKNIQLEETQKDIDYLESVFTFLNNAVSAEEAEEIRAELVDSGYLRRRKNAFRGSGKKSAPPEFRVSGGYRVLVGRNNRENDILTFKTASRNDLWFHTKDIPGSHVILFTEGASLENLPAAAIFEAASIAAYYSKGRTSENVPVDYVPVRLVKKPAGAKPGMVIFTGNRTVYVHPSIPTGETAF